MNSNAAAIAICALMVLLSVMQMASCEEHLSDNMVKAYQIVEPNRVYETEKLTGKRLKLPPRVPIGSDE